MEFLNLKGEETGVPTELKLGSTSKIFVGNLPFKTINLDLTELFSGFGQVVGINIRKDRNTDKSKGFAFITFSTAEAATNAIANLHGKSWQGRVLTVKPALARGQQNIPATTSAVVDDGGGWATAPPKRRQRESMEERTRRLQNGGKVYKNRGRNGNKKSNKNKQSGKSWTSWAALPAEEPKKTVLTNDAPTKASPTKASPTKASPTKASPTKASPTKASPTKASPTKASPTKASKLSALKLEEITEKTFPKFVHLFSTNECLIAIGREHNDEKMIRNGELYVAGVKKSEQSSWETFHSIFGGSDETCSNRLWVLMDGNVLVGSVGVKKMQDSIYELVRMYVDSAYRKKGYGKMLVQHLIQYVQSQVSTTESKSTNEFTVKLTTPSVNINGIGFYKRLGFVQSKSLVVQGPDKESLNLSELIYKKTQ
jgi:cold-inducible RNA-binding protein